ncbi:pyrroline-5-carboxylate reductase 3-like isoform X3 [Macrobrachium nipponense]|uniref:pyrroline-5-carboxylate reductase 3-like isoform X3 n=1 Tax=Macrobrachium nipponense TaxID=159736 RepID=UPI0030C83D57
MAVHRRSQGLDPSSEDGPPPRLVQILQEKDQGAPDGHEDPQQDQETSPEHVHRQTRDPRRTSNASQRLPGKRSLQQHRHHVPFAEEQLARGHRACDKELTAGKSELFRHANSRIHEKHLQYCKLMPCMPKGPVTETAIKVVPVPQDGAVSPAPSGKEVIIPASIGFIGAGNMAQALMNSFLAKGLVEPHLLMASAPSNRNLEKLPSGMRTTNDNNRLVKECDIIFLCVKPHLLTEMIEGLDPLERDHSPLFISVVTGFDICTLEQLLGSLIDAPRVVRTMPNTPCMVGQGCCVYTMGTNTNESDAKVVCSILHSVGYSAEIPEYQMDAACGLAGSGPAYIYTAIEALADGGVKMGLPRHLAHSLAAHTVKGAASMVLQSGKHPAQLKDEVCSPGGTTITAIHSLEKNGFRGALISAVEASANRAKELGNKS